MADFYEYWLAALTGLPAEKKRAAVLLAGSAERLFKMSPKERKELSRERLLPEGSEPVKERLFSERQAALLSPDKTEETLKEEFEAMLGRGIRLVCEGDFEYPARLSSLAARPYALFVKGRLPEEDILSVAVVGARRCSEYGRYTAEQFGARLAAAGVSVISGLALGIDGIAQGSAADAGGAVYGVPGCGIGVCYPRENRALYEKVEKGGGIISEYAPETEPRAMYFPQRNRIISGLSDCVLLVEAREKSGSLITADFALEQGRELYAVPGRVTDRLSDGCNRLLKQGAGIALSPEDLVAELLAVTKKKREIREGNKEGMKGRGAVRLTETEQAAYEALDLYPQPIEKIKKRMEEKTAVTLPELSCCLMRLCALGAAACVSGIYYEKRMKNEIIS